MSVYTERADEMMFRQPFLLRVLMYELLLR